MNPRYTALQILAEVIIHRHSLTKAFELRLNRHNPKSDHSFIKNICFGVLRFYPRLEIMLNQLVKKPLSKKNNDLYVLLLIGLYQLFYMKVSQHAVVSETVNTVIDCQKVWAKSLINAVLRNALRQSDQLKNLELDNVVAQYAHPTWLIDKIKNDFPQCWEQILITNNEHPPMALRVNLQRLSRQDYLQQLTTKGIAAKIAPVNSTGLWLEHAVNVIELPGFEQGDCSVQDVGAQFAPQLLQLKPDQRVLDSCAGPGGKLAHLLEFIPGLQTLVGLEPDKQRLQLVADNLKRLRLQADLICARAEQLDAWWDAKLFDRILVDAPCSGSGVIRRHPDIKLLRRESDILQFSKQQYQLIDSLWPLVKPGGILLYVTCSIFPEENEKVIGRFLQAHQDASEMVIAEDWGVSRPHGRVIVPGQQQMDGFYYGRLLKLEGTQVQ